MSLMASDTSERNWRGSEKIELTKNVSGSCNGWFDIHKSSDGCGERSEKCGISDGWEPAARVM